MTKQARALQGTICVLRAQFKAQPGLGSSSAIVFQIEGAELGACIVPITPAEARAIAKGLLEAAADQEKVEKVVNN